MSDLPQDAARRVYRMLCFMAWCDGELAEEERHVLLAFRVDLGLDESDAAALELEGKAADGLTLGEDEAELAYLVDGLIEIAIADGKLALEEQAGLTQLAELIKLPNLLGQVQARVSDRQEKLEIMRFGDSA